MRKTLLVVLLLLMGFLGFSFLSRDIAKERETGAKVLSSDEIKKERINQHVTGIKEFLKKSPNYNSEIVFLVDMKIMSGKNRFFIYNLTEEKVVDEGLVAHGIGSETGKENELKFSNVNNSRATSLGKYSIGESYYGQFGKSYRLYGLDKSNSNALIRAIVLHKYSKMPYEEQDFPVCNSFGCPMVNEIFYKRIEKLLDTSDKKVLLEIYY